MTIDSNIPLHKILSTLKAAGWQLTECEVWEDDWIKYALCFEVTSSMDLDMDVFWHIESESLVYYVIWSSYWDDDDPPWYHLGFDSSGEKHHLIHGTPQPKKY